MQETCVFSTSPSLNSYSNTKLADIAARVAQEFASHDLYEDEFYLETEEKGAGSEYVERDNENTVEEEFEFAIVTRDSELPSPFEILHKDQIRPVYPLFNRDLLNWEEKSDRKEAGTIRGALRKLFSEERESTMTSSCSSSAADDLDGIPEESYCVWRPKEAAAAEERSSAGSSSKRWRFKDLFLLNRSPSHGSKDDFLILSASNSTEFGGRNKQNEGKVAPVRSAAASPARPGRW